MTGEQQQTVNARLMQGVDLLGDGTNFTQKAEENAPAENTEASVRTVGGKQIGTVQTHGSTTITANARQGATIEVAAKSATRPAPDNDDNAYLGAAALAVLWWLMRDKEETNLVDYESGNSNAANTYSPLNNQVTDNPVVPWVRYYTDNGIAPVQGMALGIDTQFGNSGQVRLSVMPEATGKSNTGRLHLNESSSFEGHNFMLESRFGRDSIFATVHASRGQYQTHSSFRSNATQGRLSGNFNMVQNHFQASAGIQFEPVNGLELISTIGIYRGSVQQSEFVAGNSVLTTTLPSNTRKVSWLEVRAKCTIQGMDWHFRCLEVATTIWTQHVSDLYRWSVIRGTQSIRTLWCATFYRTASFAKPSANCLRIQCRSESS